MMDAVGGIRRDLVDDAQSYDGKRERRRNFLKFGSAVALLLLAVAITLPLLIHPGQSITPGKNSAVVIRPSNPVVEDWGNTDGNERASLPESLRSVRVRASGTDGKVIPTSESFVIETDEPCTAEEVAEALTLTPKTDYSIRKLSDTSYEVIPGSGTLFPGTLYRLTFGDPENPAVSYSFQTESELVVKSILPSNQSTGVPVNTGIEIYFSEAIGSGDFSELLTIEPAVSCTYMLYPDGRTLAVIPDGDLAYRTIYTVTVSENFESLSGKRLGAPVTAQFCTQSDTDISENYLSLSISGPRRIGNVSTSEPFAYATDEEIALSYSTWFSDTTNPDTLKGTAELYRFSSAEEAVKAIKRVLSNRSDPLAPTGFTTDGLTLVGTFNAGPDEVRPHWTSGMFSLGGGYDRGFYLAKCTFSIQGAASNESLTCTKYIPIQVTDLRALTVSSDGKTLLRLDNVFGGSTEGASILCESFRIPYRWNCGDNEPVEYTSSRTQISGGLSMLETGKDDGALLTITCGEDTTVLCVRCEETDDSEFRMSYLYTDREVYFSNDTVRFSGFVRSLNGTLPSSLYVRFAGSSVLDELKLGENGTFSGSVPIESYSEGGGFLSVVDAEGRTYASKYIRITEQEKPTITASLSFDRLFYRYGETAVVTLKATFFDGTPAEGFSFYFESNYFGFSETLKTDRDGIVKFEIRTGDCPAYSTDPVGLSVSAQLVDWETQTLSLWETVPYFHSDYIFRTVYEDEKRQLTLHHLDTSKLLTPEDLEYPAYPDNTVGEPADGTVGYVLMKFVITRTEYEEYDSYTKRKYKRYDYNRTETQVQSGKFTFSDGVIDLPLYEVEGFTGGYYYIIDYSDGRNTYEITVSATKSDPWFRTYEQQYSPVLSFDRESYRIGETYKTTFSQNGQALSGTLFAVIANGIEEFALGESFTGRMEGYPALKGTVVAAAFDPESRGYYVYSARIPLDPTGNELQLSVTSDKEVYAPGETATITVTVRDAAGSHVILSIADEACFALGDQNENALKKYYQSTAALISDSTDRYYSNYRYWWWDEEDYWRWSDLKPYLINGRVSLVETERSRGGADEAESNAEQPSTEPAAEDANYSNSGKGSEESETRIRENFSDNPLFLCGTVGADGTATFVFTVPDNITSWRATATAADFSGGTFDSVRIGNGVSNLIATLDFFLNLSAPSYYIEGDDAALLARAFGSLSDGTVSYTAVLTDDAGNELKTVTASDDSKGYAELNFGKLSVGTYTATVIGRGNSASDGVRTTFEVIKSAEYLWTNRLISLEEISFIRPARYPVTLTFVDESMQNGVYSSALSSLKYQKAGRCESLIAEYVASLCSKRLYGAGEELDLESFRKRLSDYYHPLLSYLPYGDGSVELTAEVLASAADLLSANQRSSLVRTLNSMILEEMQVDPVSLCATLSALASLNEPVLDILYSVANAAGNYSAEAKLYLASAFAALGDWQAANAIYTKIRTEIGVEDTEYGTLKLSAKTNDETIRLTSLALLSASRCSRSDAEKLARWLFENRSETQTGVSGLTAFVRYYLADATYSEKTLTYRIGDRETTVTVKPFCYPSVTLLKSEFDSFTVLSADQGIAAVASYYAPAQEVLADRTLSNRISVHKSIEQYKDGMYVVSLTVSGTSTRVWEYLDLSDTIPSGARYVFTLGSSYSWEDNASGWIGLEAGQRMTGGISIYGRSLIGTRWDKTECPEYSFRVTVEYVIRGAVKGEFVAEPAIVRNLGSDIYTVSERYAVRLSDDAWVVTVK